MNNTQNQKIVQVTDKTLIVGVDIGSENHYARAILARGFEVSKHMQINKKRVLASFIRRSRRAN